MISERRLRKWRREALLTKELAKSDENFILMAPRIIIEQDRMLKLTRELLDQALLKKGGKNE